MSDGSEGACGGGGARRYSVDETLSSKSWVKKIGELRNHQPSQIEQIDGFKTPSFETCNWT